MNLNEIWIMFSFVLLLLLFLGRGGWGEGCVRSYHGHNRYLVGVGDIREFGIIYRARGGVYGEQLVEVEVSV